MLLIGFHLGGFRGKANKAVSDEKRANQSRRYFDVQPMPRFFSFGSVFVMITRCFAVDYKYGTLFVSKPKRSKSQQPGACAFKGEVHKLTLYQP